MRSLFMMAALVGVLCSIASDAEARWRRGLRGGYYRPVPYPAPMWLPEPAYYPAYESPYSAYRPVAPGFELATYSSLAERDLAPAQAAYSQPNSPKQVPLSPLQAPPPVADAKPSSPSPSDLRPVYPMPAEPAPAQPQVREQPRVPQSAIPPPVASASPRSAPAARPTPATTVVTITAHDNSFRPESVTVPPGTTVRWTNAGTHKLTVTSDQNLWDSGDLEPGQSYEATFRRAGTYSYRCRHHPRDEMRGTIVVSNGEAATIARPGE